MTEKRCFFITDRKYRDHGHSRGAYWTNGHKFALYRHAAYYFSYISLFIHSKRIRSSKRARYDRDDPNYGRTTSEKVHASSALRVSRTNVRVTFAYLCYRNLYSPEFEPKSVGGFHSTARSDETSKWRWSRRPAATDTFRQSRVP